MEAAIKFEDLCVTYQFPSESIHQGRDVEKKNNSGSVLLSSPLPMLTQWTHGQVSWWHGWSSGMCQHHGLH